ncbi:hypothetical protein N7478_011381 [Penicillium angulare]|uniref:uncharacterized protein n=1 Tax=Penicillium angulare TaxID=116970 RepID=UPI002540289A|nr:uncharacterized protein N7478_011381 [Penicillium angulare]KAJ5263776.1 hypothetical protein N7478_011381 [Penicillium angulare]
MRLLYKSLQCQLTAVVTAAAIIPSVFATTPRAHTHAHVTDILSDGAEADEDSSVRATDIINGAGLPFALDSFNGLELRHDLDDEKEGDSIGLDLVRRAPPADSTSIINNNFQHSTINIGGIQYWYVPASTINGPHGVKGAGLPQYVDSDGSNLTHQEADELRRRDGKLNKRASTLYLSLVTCTRPSTNVTGEEGSFPQLKMYVSQSDDLKEPGPGKDDSLQTVTTSDKGYLGMDIEADSDVWISVVADNTTSYSGSYSYNIAASIDEPYYNLVADHPFLYFVDSDQSAALLVTNNLTQSEPGSQNFKDWMNVNSPYTMFAHNLNDTSLSGMESSFCAVNSLSTVVSNPSNTGMTSRGLGNKPKEQFYVQGLKSSSTYIGILGMVGNSSTNGVGNNITGGGGIVWQPMNFTTKTENNCAVLFNLTFCEEVAYAVPSNPNKTVEELRQIYDNYTRKYYQNFNYSLQQIQCNASQESMFSLAVNCTDCAQEYKQWLCSVSIPRCADFSSNETYLRVRNAGQDFINGSSLPENDPFRCLVLLRWDSDVRLALI